MVYKRRPEGSSISHYQEYRAADAISWRWRFTIHHWGWGMDDVHSEIVVHLLRKRPLFDPTRGEYSTWCWTLAHRYLARKREAAQIQERRMAKWTPRCIAVLPDHTRENDEIIRLLLTTVEMTRRQRRVLTLWCGGKTLADIAEEFGFSRARAGQLLAKAVKRTRLQAMRIAKSAGCPADEFWEAVA